MKKEFKVREECPACDGTGLYIGMGEGEGAAIACHKCNGTGCREFIHNYTPFSRRKDTPIGVVRVFETNPGIGIGNGNGFILADFGGIPVKEWELGLPFPPKSEMREFTCPAWWYQSADNGRKPEWKECRVGTMFCSCEMFKNKDKCWERFDNELS